MFFFFIVVSSFYVEWTWTAAAHQVGVAAIFFMRALCD